MIMDFGEYHLHCWCLVQLFLLVHSSSKPGTSSIHRCHVVYEGKTRGVSLESKNVSVRREALVAGQGPQYSTIHGCVPCASSL